MSIPVEIDDLAAALGDYGWTYLLTVRDDLRTHVVAVSPVWEDSQLVTPVGRGTARNLVARPNVTLCYPPLDGDGYSLIVDGEAAVNDDHTTMTFRPITAVLHRPAPEGFGGSPTGCGQDCVPVSPVSPEA